MNELSVGHSRAQSEISQGQQAWTTFKTSLASVSQAKQEKQEMSQLKSNWILSEFLVCVQPVNEQRE